MTFVKKHLCALSFLVSLSSLAFPVHGANIRVMTQNQYLGADLLPIFTATDAVTFNAALVEALQTVAANKPVERMRALARDIARERPELVGLQEAIHLRCAGAACSDPTIAAAFSDHLQITLDALKGTYVEVAAVLNLDLPNIPFVVNGVPAVLSITDRDVILARKGVAATPVNFQSLGGCPRPAGDGCNYSIALEVPTLLGAIAVERGFVGVDSVVDGKNHRFVNTHLEIQRPDPSNPASQFFQSAQAAELIQILLSTTPPDRSLIVVGDMNSSPDHPVVPGIPSPYQQFVNAGFIDVWEFRAGNQAGYTCCQAEDLSNRRSELYERVDMIFSFADPAEVKKLRLVGDHVSDKTRPPGLGLWPSDHAAVAAELQFHLLHAVTASHGPHARVRATDQARDPKGQSLQR